MKTIKLIMVLGFVLCIGATHAQTFTYSYDAAGNRVKREVSIIQPQMLMANDAASDSISTQGDAESTSLPNAPAFAVNIYPNPTSGHLTIELPELPLGEQGNITVHNGMGRVVYQQAKVTNAQNLSLYNLSPGYYVVRIVIGDKMVMRTIIKQ